MSVRRKRCLQDTRFLRICDFADQAEKGNMRSGKISQAAEERSVLRPLKKTGVLAGEAGYGKDCIFASDGTVRSSVLSAADGFCMPRAEMVLDDAVNRLGSAEEIRLSVDMILPAESDEGRLKELTLRLGQEALKAGAVIENFQARVSGSVTDVIVSVKAEGKTAGYHLPEENGKISAAGLDLVMAGYAGAAGLDLVMAGYAGAAGTAVLERNFHEKLAVRFPEAFLREADRLAENLQTGKIVKTAAPCCFRTVGEGGVFAALWEMCEGLGCGLEADIHRIPIRQQTVEICEYLNRNPYRLYGAGAVLMAVRGGEALAEMLLPEGIKAEVIGRLTEGPGRYIHNREITRCLEKPLADALIEEG